ncbi:hypothetical protein [Deinococcus aluminii]|uniref:DUF2470 domain-containing protein n=1 Tax=Deinococcus aluminii TaxID=1656885 RepID=A0ABP9XFG5_9DEIO
MGTLSSPRAVRQAYARRVRACYGDHATQVSVTLTPTAQSLRVTDQHGEVIPPRDDVPFDELLALLDDTLASGGPGILTLSGRPQPAPTLPPVPPREVFNPLLPW